MITEDQIRGLSEDPDLAFTEYETIVRNSVLRDRDENGNDVERTYIAHVLAFIHEYDINLDIDDQIPSDSDKFWSYYNEFLERIDYYKARVRLRSFHRNVHSGISTVVSLSSDYRSEIHIHLSSIRKIVTAVDMVEARRESLFAKINALAAEVDRRRTRLEAFTAMYLDVTYAVGEGAENLEPLMNKIERLAKIFGKAKAENEAGQLPAPPERKMISGPELGDQVRSEPDDDIPF